jgi:hypothetical protein
MCLGAVASAAGAATPVVATGSATSIEATSATLHGSVNPNGTEVTDCVIEYGASTSYGLHAACVPVVGSTPVAVSASLASLGAGATYHYRISVAYKNGSEELHETGADASFVTQPLVTTSIPSAYVSYSGTQAYVYANLSGSVQAGGSGVIDCHFEYGTSPSLGSNVPCAQSLGTYGGQAYAAVNGLQWATSYYARLSASNLPGRQTFGAIQTFQTPSPIVYPPYRPPPSVSYTPYPPYTYTNPPYNPPNYYARPSSPSRAALARCMRMRGDRRSKCLAGLRRRGGGRGGSGPASDRGLSVYYCRYGRTSARRAVAHAASTSEAGWPPKECLKMDKGPAGQHHTIVGMRHVHNWLLGGYGSDTIIGGDKGDVIWGDYQDCCWPKHQTAIIHAGNGRNVIYANDTLNYVWTGKNPKTVVHAHANGISGVIHCGSSSQVIFLSVVSERHFKLDGCGRISHFSVGY